MPNSTTQADLLPKYAQLLSNVVIKLSAIAETKQIVDRILSNLSRYRAIELKTRVPWWFIAGLHSLECSGDFAQHLANGDPIHSPTVNEPTGIPAGTWEECAIAALELKGWLEPDTTWKDPLIAIWRAERYNGFGCSMFHSETPSPYLWGGTNHQKPGKYVSDGKWDGSAVSRQIGVVAIWMALGIDLRKNLNPPQATSTSVSDVSNLKPMILTSLEELAKESQSSIGTLFINRRTCFKDKPLQSTTPGARLVWVDPDVTDYDIIKRFPDQNGHYHLLLRLPSGKEIEVYIYGLDATMQIKNDDGSGGIKQSMPTADPKNSTYKIRFKLATASSNSLIFGTLEFLKDNEVYNTLTATSSLPGRQQDGSWNRTGGLLPPTLMVKAKTGSGLSVKTTPIYMPQVVGVSGNFYQISPFEMKTDGNVRGDWGLHRDANMPGSMGCIVFPTERGWEACQREMKVLAGLGIRSIELICEYT